MRTIIAYQIIGMLLVIVLERGFIVMSGADEVIHGRTKSQKRMMSIKHVAEWHERCELRI